MSEPLSDELVEPEVLTSERVFDGMVWGVRAETFRYGGGELRRHHVVERLAFNDGLHVSLRELRTDDQAHLPAVREEMGGALRRVLKLGR